MPAPDITPDVTGQSQLATRYAIQIKRQSTPTWDDEVTAPVLFGVQSFKFAVSRTKVDTSDADSNGWGADFTTQRKFALNLSLKSKLYNGQLDPGQQLLSDISNGVNVENIDVRWFLKSGGDDARQGVVDVDYTDNGGDVKTDAMAMVVLSGQGEPVEIENPLASAVVPTITTALPTLATVGEYVELVGTGFTGAITATMDGAAVTDIIKVSPTRLLIKVPATVAGAAAILVSNTAGPSVAKAYTAQ